MPKKGSSVLLKHSILPHKRREMSQSIRRRQVLKMLAVMEAQQMAGPSNGTNSTPVTPECGALNTEEFLSTGRTGRRNALPDILSEHALVSSADLPARLQSLTTNDPVPSSSKDCTNAEASGSNS